MEGHLEEHTSLISNILIEKLFGTLTYNIHTSDDDKDLLLLYGENGAGKSTILKLIYHLLNSEPYEGHRTAVSRIPFSRVAITLTSGMVVTALKNDPFANDTYSLRMIPEAGGREFEYTWRHDSNRKDNEKTHYTEYCNALKKAGIKFHFLSDNRRVEGLTDETNRQFISGRHRQYSHYDIDFARHREILRHRDLDDSTDMTEILVHDAIERTLQWFQQQALSGASAGYTSVNAIYLELLRRIVEPVYYGESDLTQLPSKLQSNLRELDSRNPLFSRYGLTPELDTKLLVELLDKAKENHAEILNTILQPYLDGHNARLDALQPVQKIIDEFATILEDFFSRKTIKLDVRNELAILSDDGARLNPRMLSSGEKQLLLLLCNAITARNNGTIFIIDEPEISLNVKWQRRLIKALLTCLQGVDSQLIMATHSIEILSQYKSSVVSLDDAQE